MDRSSKPQLALFADELPHWEALSPERQEDVQQVLSLLLEAFWQQSQATPPLQPEHTYV